MPTWRELVRTEILDLVQDRAEPVFTRQELLVRSGDAFRQKSTGQTPAQNVSQSLQHLRDAGLLEFVEPGVYRVLASNAESSDRWEQQGPRRPPVKEPTYTQVQGLSRDFQDWLRSHVMPNFHHSCGVCGLGPEWFLEAAHLRPVRQFPDLAGDAGAAVALCGNHHKALDAGLLTIEKDLRLSVTMPPGTRPSPELERVLTAYDGRELRRPAWSLTAAALPSLPARPKVES